ncbi:polyprenyl synthetase family protein [Agromyces soli]|uniref:Polyprenyl synthetase family protein n=1 Tax=Agromyces soli TaxID=659012 RepID=A0ABY4AUT9_9MICO|nr:polyprenyl synthetase family protein [Agromyces soli]UOE26934.1 polyprenyl synthetase family protein [Agromyces soli]
MSLVATVATPPRQAEVERYLGGFFDDAIVRADAHAADYRRLWAAARDAASGGKRIRPRLVLGAYDALAPVAARDDAEPAAAAEAVALAAAFELLHTAFLVHDDVIDRDLVRRGEPNVAGRFALDAALRGLERERADAYGQASAILAGDLLIAAAHSVVAGLDVPVERRRAILAVLDECVFAAAAGEHADVRHAAGVRPGEADILAMIEDKTACYSFSAPLRAGALLAGAPRATVERLGEIGRRLGVAFQLQDDVLGVYGDERVTGKTTLGDLREGKETLLIAYARGHAAWVAASSAFGRPDLDEAGARPLRAAIEASGARARVESRIAEEAAAARAAIASAGLPTGLETELLGLAAEATRRSR